MPYNYSTSPTKILSQTFTQTANIVSYNPTTKSVVLDKPISVSLGYNAVVGQVSSTYSISGTSVNISQAANTGGVPTFSTDESGNFVGIFNVPSGIFQTGSRVFRVDNRTVATDPTSATCYAEATFTASGLSTQSQQLEFSPSVDSSASTFTSVQNGPSQLVSSIVVKTPYDPIAQSFLINKANFPNGVFLNSIKVFFAKIPSSGNYPVTLSIVPTVNGFPNGQALSYSTVTMSGNQINVSANPYYLDPTTYTEFVFNAPVYIQSGTLYAFMLQASSPDYQVYLAQQNEIAVPSTTPNSGTKTTKIGAAPYVGALFESQNSITWTADQTKDLMFVIDQCVFNTNVQPNIQFNVLQGLPFRKYGRNDINHKLNPSTVQNNYGNLGSVTGLAAVNGSYQIPVHMRSDAYNLTTTDFVPTSTGISYQYSSTLANGLQPTGPYSVNPGTYGSPNPTNLFLGDGLGERLLLANSNTSFVMSATMSSTDANVSPIIADDGVTLYNVRYMVNNMNIGNNVVSLVTGGSGYLSNGSGIITSTSANAAILVSAPTDTILGSQATLAANVANGVIQSVWVINPGSGYIITPTVTITGSNTSTAVASIIGETSPHGGNGWAKYFTKKVVLNRGQDSGDLRVFLSAYKPQGSQVYIYYKILSSNDTQQFDAGSWQLMTQVGAAEYSTDQTNIIEFEYAPGTWLPNNGYANNQISYTNTNGTTFSNFIQFAIKVVMATNDNTNPPFLTNIRALALPSGTNI